MPEGGRVLLLSPDLGEGIQPSGYQKSLRFQQTVDLFEEHIDIFYKLKQGDGRDQLKSLIGKGEMSCICLHPETFGISFRRACSSIAADSSTAVTWNPFPLKKLSNGRYHTPARASLCCRPASADHGSAIFLPCQPPGHCLSGRTDHIPRQTTTHYRCSSCSVFMKEPIQLNFRYSISLLS